MLFFQRVSLGVHMLLRLKTVLSLNLVFSNTEPYNHSGTQHDATSLKHANFSLMLCQFFLNGNMSACTHAYKNVRVCVCV